jgi:hypothetical protein
MFHILAALYAKRNNMARFACRAIPPRHECRGLSRRLVTGNMADRARMVELSGADLKPIKGRTLDRSKGETLSGWSLDDLLSRLGYDSTQVSLF